ncbi:MAG: HPr family phosphocarrier protein [Candidatus Omnitrophica bacterium]|nr:HPr family phosphocarrier protein [Candidatus Omnitrophota bacterium]
MIKKEVIVRNGSGLHARPAAMFVQIANKYSSVIKIVKDGQEVNGKSIMGILMLAAEKGARVVLTVDGVDAEAAAQELETFLLKEKDPEM